MVASAAGAASVPDIFRFGRGRLFAFHRAQPPLSGYHYPKTAQSRRIAGEAKPPYSIDELALLAQHCTQKEDDANKAERSVHKSIAAAAMARQIGQTFEGFITGSSDKGVWVRLVHPPVEGKVEGAAKTLAVGDRVRVKLISTDPEHGYIDFSLLAS